MSRAPNIALGLALCLGASCSSAKRAGDGGHATAGQGGAAATATAAAGSGGANVAPAAGSGGAVGAASPATVDAGAAAGLATMPALNADSVLRGSCAKSTVQSELLPANILFVLDRSGSMACNPPPTTDSAACEAEPMRADASMPSKWEVTTSALLDAIKNLPASTGVGLSYFSNDDRCGVSSIPSVPILPNDQAQQAAIEKNLASVKPGGGTPIVGATILAYKHLHESALAGSIFGNEFVVLITDGAQSEMCSDPGVCDDAASCTDLLVSSEVPKAAGPGVGIRTFVIGVPGSEPARSVLSQIAQAGGTAPAGCDPQQGNCHFDMSMVSDLGPALSKALMQISGQTISCELDVPQPTSGELDVGLVNVVYTPSDGSQAKVLRQDARMACDAGADGWQYADDNRKIRLCGQTCDTVRADEGARVDVVIGCPVQAVK